MRQILIEIEDEAYEKFLGMLELCPQVVVAGRNELPNDAPDEVTRRVSLAIKVLQHHKTIRHLYDYTWIMAAIGDGIVEGMSSFGSPQKFIDYLKSIGVERVPSRSTISTWNSRFFGKFPNWEFVDTQNPKEIQRRKNVANHLKSVLNELGNSKKLNKS